MTDASEPGGDTAKSNSALKRYLPVLAVIVVVAAIAGVFAITSADDDEDETSVGDTGEEAASSDPSSDGSSDATGGEGIDGEDSTGTDGDSALPISYADAVAAGTVDDYDWGPDCDLERGRLAYPSLLATPCVPVWDGSDNGGATAQGVTEDTIRVAYYVPPDDPQAQALLELSGGYDDQESVVATRLAYQDIFNEVHEMYGRRVELVRLDGTGSSSDSVAARADAIRAAEELDVFAVINGPTQTKAFAEELAKRGVLCVGNCLISQPESFWAENQYELYTTSASPEQSGSHTLEFIAKQLDGKPAEFAGDPELQSQTRSFALLTYDTPDGNFTPAWETFKQEAADAGVEIVDHVTYFLDLARTQEDARTIITALKASGATSVIFSGDPIIPIFFTEEATAQGYFPEWILAGTVLADTTVLARPYDPQQWQNAFGYTALQVRTPQEDQAAYRTHEWWYGEPPPSENSYQITFGFHQLLSAGIQMAGPNLTAETFHDGLYGLPPNEAGENGLNNILDWDESGGFWDRPDHNGNDNASLIWWDPDATGPDETGTDGQGMYRYVDGGRRYLPGEWPEESSLFEQEGSVTLYEETPAELLPPDYPTHPASPLAGG